MPKVTVTVEHNQSIDAVVEKVTPAIEKTVADFQGHDLALDCQGDRADFKFKSLGFTIGGDIHVEPSSVTVNLELPFAAMIYKEKAKKGIAKSVTKALEQ